MSRSALRAGALAVASILFGGLAASPAFAAPPTSDWAPTIAVSNAYGLDFNDAGTELYVARRDAGISIASADGTVTPLIVSNTSFMAVAVEADGDLLFTVDSDPNIYRLPRSAISPADPDLLIDDHWRSHAQIVFTEPVRNFLYGLEVADDGTIYYSTFNDRQINVLRNGVSSLLLTSSLPDYVTSLELTDGGDLVVTLDGSERHRIAASALTSGQVDPASIEALPSATTFPYGMATFDDELTYYSVSGGALVKSQLPPKTLASAAPAVLGDPREGSTLTADEGAWTTGTGFSYQWEADGNPITAATARTYVPTSADVGASITVVITGSRVGYATTTRVSDPVTITSSATPPTVSANPAILPATGAEVDESLGASVLMLALGALALIVGSRRGTRTH